MDFRFVLRQSRAPFWLGVLGGAAAWLLAGANNAKGFTTGALLIAVATLVSSGFYSRRRVSGAGVVLIRLALASALKWIVVVGGAALALVQGGVPPAAFTFGVIAGLVSTLFNGIHSSTGASTS